MPLLNHNINNLNGGVSQQPTESRFDNQVESMENCLVTVAQGLRRRNPALLLGAASVAHHANTAVHSYSRGDGQRQYAMTLCEHGLQVYDPEDAITFAKTVHNAGVDVIAEWAGTDWKKDVRFVTVGDTTWVLNKSKVVGVNENLATLGDSDVFYTPVKVDSILIKGTSALLWSSYYIDGYLRCDVTYNGVTYNKTSGRYTKALSYFTGTTLNLTSVAKDLLDDSVNLIPDVTWDGTNIVSDTAATQVTEVDFVWVPFTGTSHGLMHTESINVGAEQNPSLGDRAFFWVNRTFDEGSATTKGFTYQVVLDGFTFSENHEDSITVATNLATAINNDVTNTPNISARSEGSIVFIHSADNFTFESGDSWGNQASFGWKDSVAKLSDLPSSMDGFSETEVGTIGISGTDTDNFTNYYLTWRDDKWVEVFGIGMRASFDNRTLPAKIVQVDDDTFEFGFVDKYKTSDAPVEYTTTDELEAFTSRWFYEWTHRLKGDDDSNPIPSFAGRKISNMFFFKNRLGFTSEDNVILSESGSYYNFFATTAMEVLDSDPIDAGIDSNSISTIKSVNSTSGSLTLWSDNAQFLLAGGEILSPATTRVSQTSSYSAISPIEPLVVDNEILFFGIKGNWTESLSYSPASLQADKSSAESISAHTPEYLPKDIDTVCVSSVHNLVFFCNKAEPTKVYVYKYYISGGERKISAWFTWTFAETIIDINVLNSKLYILAGTTDILEIDLEPQDLAGSFLDRGITSYKSEVILSEYNVMTNQKTMTTRDKFYMKNIKVEKDGKVDFVIINNERNKETVVNNKHLGRKLVVGGNTSKVNTGFRSEYPTGFEINTISLEGRLEPKSKNI